MKGFTFMLACAASVALAAPVLAKPPTAEMARVCRQQALEAYPTPRIGTMEGVATAQREFFRDCVARMQEEQGN
jgi:hypothetical protein